MHKEFVCNTFGVTPALKHMPCFALYCASRAVAQTYRAVLVADDLTYPQFVVIVALASTGSSSVGSLASEVGLDAGTLSPLLRRLEGRGILTRERPADDERTVMVALTKEGQVVHDRAMTKAQVLAPAYGIDDLDELNDLVTRLHRITTGMTGLTENLRVEALN